MRDGLEGFGGEEGRGSLMGGGSSSSSSSSFPAHSENSSGRQKNDIEDLHTSVAYLIQTYSCTIHLFWSCYRDWMGLVSLASWGGGGEGEGEGGGAGRGVSFVESLFFGIFRSLEMRVLMELLGSRSFFFFCFVFIMLFLFFYLLTLSQQKTIVLLLLLMHKDTSAPLDAFIDLQFVSILPAFNFPSNFSPSSSF